MLSLMAVDAILAISEAELIEELILTLLAAPQLALFFEKHPRLKQAITRDVGQWRDKLKARLADARIPATLGQEVQLYQQAQLQPHREIESQLPYLLSQLQALDSPFYGQGQQLIASNPTFTPSLHTLFLQRWRLSLVLQVTAINQALLQEEQEALLNTLQQRLTLSGQLSPVLGSNDEAAGRLWDLSAAPLKRGDYQRILQYGDFLNGQPELLELARQLGRSREAKNVPQKDAPLETWHTWVREPATVPEQVEGIHQSDDILRLLPPELATLGISELEYEFYRRLVEKQLLTYRLQGDAWREKEVQRPVIKRDSEKQPQGPFIVCVDTSGSMGGFNEQCAKAFCLALMRIALEERRRCYVMLFSGGVVQYELTAEDGLEQAIRFLSQQFRGGTDLGGCLHQVVDKLNTPDWQDADTVIISDFIAQRLPDEVILAIGKRKLHAHRFHALAMSGYGKPGIMRIFDYVWRFDTGLKGRLMRRLKH